MRRIIASAYRRSSSSSHRGVSALVGGGSCLARGIIAWRPLIARGGNVAYRS